MKIPPLENLDLPPWLPGETPPPSTNGGYLAPDGQALRGGPVEVWTRITRYRQEDPECDLKTELPLEGSKGLIVSTVYMGLDHQWSTGSAMFWETMIVLGTNNFDGWQDYQWRYSTKAAAHAGHRTVVETLETFFGTTARPAGMEAKP